MSVPPHTPAKAPLADLEAVTTLLVAMGFADLAPLFRTHFLPWARQEDVFVFATGKFPGEAARLLELWEAVRDAPSEVALHTRFETGLKPPYLTKERADAVFRYLKGPPHFPFDRDSTATREQVLRLSAPTAIIGPTPIPCGSYLGAQLVFQLVCSRSTTFGDTPEAAARTASRFLATLGPLCVLNFDLTPSDDPTATPIEARALGIPLRVGAPWNGPESLCPLLAVAETGAVVSLQCLVGGALKWVEQPPLPVTSVVGHSGETTLVIRLPPLDARPPAFYRHLALVLGALWVETQFGPRGFHPAPLADEASEGFFAKAAEHTRAGLWVARPRAPPEEKFMLVRDGGKALLEGTAEVPERLPMAATLRVWLGKDGDSVRGSDDERFNHANRTKAAFFVGNELMTEATFPLWVAKAERHTAFEIRRDLAGILRKCAEARAAKGWAIHRRGD